MDAFFFPRLLLPTAFFDAGDCVERESDDLTVTILISTGARAILDLVSLIGLVRLKRRSLDACVASSCLKDSLARGGSDCMLVFWRYERENDDRDVADAKAARLDSERVSSMMGSRTRSTCPEG